MKLSLPTCHSHWMTSLFDVKKTASKYPHFNFSQNVNIMRRLGERGREGERNRQRAERRGKKRIIEKYTDSFCKHLGLLGD